MHLTTLVMIISKISQLTQLLQNIFVTYIQNKIRLQYLDNIYNY